MAATLPFPLYLESGNEDQPPIFDQRLALDLWWSSNLIYTQSNTVFHLEKYDLIHVKCKITFKIKIYIQLCQVFISAVLNVV